MLRRRRCPRIAELAGDQAENDCSEASPMSIAALAVPDVAPRCDGSAVAIGELPWLGLPRKETRTVTRDRRHDRLGGAITEEVRGAGTT
jgi:hypothetical protein